MGEGRGLSFSRRALTLHAVILVIVPSFTALCVWQVTRALDGNSLSWAYVFEWPFFAGYAVYMWWRFLHEKPPALPAKVAATIGYSATSTSPSISTATGRDTGNQLADTPDADDPDAADRAAYNRYLAELAAQDKPKQW